MVVYINLNDRCIQWELFNEFQFYILGKGDNQFVLSQIEWKCPKPVNTSKACNVAAMLVESDVKPSDSHVGDGTDLPFECISDRTKSGIHSIFWNPNGLVISADAKVRQICAFLLFVQNLLILD